MIHPIHSLLKQGPLIAAVCGSGQVTAAAMQSGADLLFVLNSGYYRSVIGIGSLAGFMPFGNANDQTLHLLEEFVLPHRPVAPLVAGVLASDPTVPLDERLSKLKDFGIRGITNWPALGCTDGSFRAALENSGELTVESEANMLAAARERGFYTFGFAFDAADACAFAQSGADAIVLGSGLTRQFDDVYQHRDQVQAVIARILDARAQIDRVRRGVPCLVFGGPFTTPEDLEQLFLQTRVSGFAGGSAVDRIPVENILRSTVRRFKATAEHIAEKRGAEGMGPLIGRTARMTELFTAIKKIAPYDVNVLIEGESGTGKELIAAQIHRMSPRAQQPFVTLNCGAIPDSLLESELFGHEKGAFTGADRRRLGKFELAHKGTLFLDEIADLSPRGQVALLRAIQQGEILRVGGDTYVPVDVRILAASNQPLSKLVEQGRFRSDLFHRICHIALLAPPLRERIDDIPLLAAEVLGRLQSQLNRRILGLSPRFQQKLAQHAWPGNIRELQHVLMRAALLEDGPALEGMHFAPAARAGEVLDTADGSPLALAKHRLFRDAAERALKDNKGNKSLAAAALGVSRKTLYAWLREK
jgi:DNA-binding NtrC family response regulator/predicted TIM-barrel enzyme